MIYDRQSFSDYCLRKLGGGVVNIEVSAEQLEDRVQDAIDYYTEYHFDGIVRDYYLRKLTGTVITVASVTGFAVNDTVTCTAKGIYSTIKSIDVPNNKIYINKTRAPFGITFATTDSITNGTVTQAITVISVGDVDSGFLPTDDSIVGVIKVLNLTSVMSSGDYMFNAQYQIMMSEIKNMTSGGTQYLYGMMSYLGHLDHILRKEKDFRFNRRMNKIYLDIDWNSDVKVDDYIVIEVYKALDDETYSELLNDRWLKAYATALIKEQWGSNLSKYSGIQLPGGLKYDGVQIKQEALQEIQQLRDEAINSSAPLEFSMG